MADIPGYQTLMLPVDRASVARMSTCDIRDFESGNSLHVASLMQATRLVLIFTGSGCNRPNFA